jgi:N-acetyl-1-D-myo-inositol-2-amino-2-deoxy-alpha-D-glucopyranoside deacetylase
MPETARLLFVHAHPDDESLSNGATIAYYAGRGAQVSVVTCTLGEEGEVIGDRWAELAFDRADQLGGYRIGELTAALQALGIGAPIYLGGAGRWRDSGMAGTEKRRRERFIDADEREAVGALVAIIRRLRPHVVVTYDPNGGYGHPDHIQAHTVTTAAVAAAGSQSAGDDYPGEPWAVPKFYWTVLAADAFRAGWEALGRDDLLPEWTVPSQEEFGFGYSDDAIDAVVATPPDALAAKVSALAAHATQVVVGPTGRACALSNNMALPILGEEHYVLVAGSAGDRDARGWETDLLAGLDLSGA